MQAEDNRRAGMDSAEARRHAQRSFGGVEPVKEEMRERRTFAFVDATIQDLSHGFRLLCRRPGFTLAAGLSLSLGIGVTTVVFSVLNAVALRPLPYPEPGKLVWMTEVLKKNSTDELTITAHFLEWRRQTQTFTGLAGYNYQTRNLTGIAEPMELETARASATLLPLLGVRPALGRNFLQQEDYKGRDHVALLGHALWQQGFGADPNIVGKAVTLDGNAVVVVGVLPSDFVFPGRGQVQLITPLGKDEAAELQDNKSASLILNVIGRLKVGATLEQARAELTVIQGRMPMLPFRPTITLKMMPLRTFLFGDVAAAAWVLLAAAAFLLLIACANVSNLLLARWMQRNRELAIRSALGASRTRLVCQLLSESALLAVLACAAGIALAYLMRRPLLALTPASVSRLGALTFDARVLVFAVVLGCCTTLLFGLLPAFRSTRIEGNSIGGRGSLRMLSWIAAAEIATTLMLSTGAGLMLQSFWKLRYENLGFHPNHLVAATLTLSGAPYRDAPARQAEFVQRLLERAQNLPGVELAAVTMAGELPPGGFHATNTFAIEGRDQPLGGARPIARYPVVSPAYFAIMGIPLRQGRLLQDSDAENALPVALVNETLARRYFPGENAIGKRVRVGADDQPWRTIAGVVGDVKTSGLATAAEPSVYLPYRQVRAIAQIGLVLRSPLGVGTVAAEVRKRIAEMDPNQPVATIQAMDDRLSASVSGPRFTAFLLFTFAGLAIVLGWIGVYGVMGCRVRWQLRELAVRQALGAQPGDVLRHVLRQGLAIILPGLVLGVMGSLALSRVLAGMLYQVSAHDPLTLSAVSAGLVAAALLACWIPALRAAHADPLRYLRHD